MAMEIGVEDGSDGRRIGSWEVWEEELRSDAEV